jgi:serine/threonine-protein kinase
VESLLTHKSEAKTSIEVPALEMAAKAMAEETDRVLVGKQIGAYKITSLLGAGGMGEVYRAEDTRLGRPVAVKVLPEELAQDKDRMRRFVREARAASALNHANVAHIYEIGQSDGLHFIAMEYVEGQSLAQMMSGQPLELKEVLDIGTQAADALEEAHRKGITHRDIKPANLMITAKGQVKVLDFGLAKITRPEGEAAGSDVSTSIQTAPGRILGTLQYMSPEQVLGKELDARTDLFSLGVVLYEMTTGRLPFSGSQASEVTDRILHAQPEALARFNYEVPAELERIIRKCLEKDRERRYQSARELLADLSRLKEGSAANIVVDKSVAKPRASLRRPVAVAALMLTVVAAIAYALLFRRAPGVRPPGPLRAAQPVAQFEMSLPPGVEVFQGSSQEVAFSPAGTHVAFVGNLNGLRQVYVRDLGRLDAVAIRGSENVVSCFFSPAGDAVGFINDRGLNKVSLRDVLVTLLTPDASYYGGGTWGSDGRVTFTRNNGLWQIPAAGGTPTQVTTLAAGETLHAWPTVVNDGKTILFTSISSGGVQRARVEAVAVDTGMRQVLVESARFPRYASSGHLVFYREGGLYAAPFDVSRLAVTGQPIEVTAAVEQDTSGAPLAEMSSAGSLVYQRAGVASWRLVWVSRQGIEQPVTDAPRAYLSPHLSADNRIVVGIGSDLWIQDTRRSTFTRLTSQQSETASFPVWTPDGKQIVFRTPTGLRSIETDGSGRSRAIAETTSRDFPSSVSPDGGTLAVARLTPESSADIYVLSLTGDPAPRVLITGPAFEGGPQFSPDGRWMAYVSNDSGQFQVYLRRYPGAESRWPVSTDGGTSPLWNHAGTELFYRNGNKMMVVSVSTTTDVTLATPRVIFEQRYAYGNTTSLTNYDVSADGQRFLMVKRESGVAYLNVVLNWFSELTRLAPGGNG